ncbi:MAG: quinone-dependent dihydroorotate dehydrogenase [Halobacteriovoraceae bacterium]|nr:quinone-dependent dihydroorotate dehydrogenase [Halobacteriovoraceae bacterium]MBT5094785.1 quinone-dependent dihydroorotate dehydrogenase [Halobacteriovoraceae bacterium]
MFNFTSFTPYQVFKKIAFSLDAEVAHVQAIEFLSRFPLIASECFLGKELGDKYKITSGGLTWDFPIGLAAGLDKNAECIDFFTRIPFGAVEVGTVTPLPQEGNPKPRLFRLAKEESLRNQMGFNNFGMDTIFENVQHASRNGKILGINLGKNKLTPQEDAPQDYRKLYKKFHKVADYLVINVSSPNTPGLRDLQEESGLRRIFEALVELRAAFPKPLFLKIAPDLSEDALPSIVKLAEEFRLEGIIATNTTIIPALGAGGVSGKLLTEKAALVRKKLLELTSNSSLEIIGVGGISCFEDLWEFWQQGGKVVQIYSAFIYQGPSILNNFRKEIDEVLEINQSSSLSELLKNIKSARRR